MMSFTLLVAKLYRPFVTAVATVYGLPFDLCQSSEFYELAVKCWYLWNWLVFTAFMLVVNFSILVFMHNAGIYARCWYLCLMLVFTGIYTWCWYLCFILVFTLNANGIYAPCMVVLNGWYQYWLLHRCWLVFAVNYARASSMLLNLASHLAGSFEQLWYSTSYIQYLWMTIFASGRSPS